MTEHNHRDRHESNPPKDGKLDRELKETFPASDPPARGGATGTEPPRARVDRKPPKITREQIERAQRGDDHKENE